MLVSTFTAPELSDPMRMPPEAVNRILGHSSIQVIVPDRTLNERQFMLLLIAGDLTRFGVKLPLAASLAARIAEALCCAPDAMRVRIEFRRNGASFAFTSDEAPDAAIAAGPARFHLSFDLTEYRSVVKDAFRARTSKMAGKAE